MVATQRGEGQNTAAEGSTHSQLGKPGRQATTKTKSRATPDGVDARAEGEVGGAGLLDHVQLVGLPVPSGAKSPEIAACTHTPALKIDRSREVES